MERDHVPLEVALHILQFSYDDIYKNSLYQMKSKDEQWELYKQEVIHIMNNMTHANHSNKRIKR